MTAGVDGTVPHGSLPHDTQLIARLANDMLRAAYVTAESPDYPIAARERMLDPELRYRTHVAGRAWPRAGIEPMSAELPSPAFVDALRLGFGTDAVVDRLDQAYRSESPAEASAHGYYFLEHPAIPHQTTASSTPGLPDTRWSAPYDPYVVRQDFPALHQRVHGKRLVWLDNAATTQKPQSVIDAVSHFYEHDNSNVHRGAHTLAARATDAFEGARESVRAFLGAPAVEEIIFVRGTTEAINLVAQSYGRSRVERGDDVLVTELEHHSNIVPWQLLCAEKGATLRPIPIDDRGEVLLDEYARLLGPRTKVVALAHVSNALGTVVPVEVMTRMAHEHGAAVVVDGAQAVPHLPVDVQAIGCDFYAFSGHKVFGPTGVGVLWGRRELLDAMPPWQGGGQMIKTVTFEGSTFNHLPYKFEAGTGIIAGAVGLGAAVEYVSALGRHHIAAHEHALLDYATTALSSIPGLRLIGTAPTKAAVLSFVIDGVGVEEVGKFLDSEGVAVRAGHHCAQPALRHFGLAATVRPSLGLYNTHTDIDVLTHAVSAAARRGRR